jgi:DNA repair protein RecO (recombination protein O)
LDAEKTEAVVIRMADWSNTSRVVTFFTRDFGKIGTVAKGGKRLKGPFDSALDLLSASRIVFLRKSSQALDILTEAALIDRFRPAPDSISSFYAGCYIAELLAGLTEDYDPHPELYDTARWALGRFAAGADVPLSLARFELVALREIGQLPMFDVCIHCAEPLAVGSSNVFHVSQGGLLCAACQKQEYSTQQIQAGTAALMVRLSGSTDEMATRLTASVQQLREMRRFLTASLSGTLGRQPKSLRFLQF